MNQTVNRRQFICTSALAVAATAVGRSEAGRLVVVHNRATGTVAGRYIFKN